jgi:hypothetical protein
MNGNPRQAGDTTVSATQSVPSRRLKSRISYFVAALDPAWDRRLAGLRLVLFLLALTPWAHLRAGWRIDYSLTRGLLGLPDFPKNTYFPRLFGLLPILYSGGNLFSRGFGGEQPPAVGLGPAGPRPVRSSVWGEAILLAPLLAYPAFENQRSGPCVRFAPRRQSSHDGASYNIPPTFASVPLCRRRFPSSTGSRKAPAVIGGCLWGDQRGRHSARFCG